MNGEESCTTSTFRQKLEKLDASLSEYHKSLQIEDLEEIFSWGWDELQSLTQSNAAEAAFMLARFSYYIHKAINKNSARLHFARNQLRKVLGAVSRDYNYIYSWEEKQNAIISDNSSASKIFEYIIEYESRHQSLYNMNQEIKNISESLKQLQFAKRSLDRENQ